MTGRNDVFEFAKTINNLFSLSQQGKELLSFAAEGSRYNHAALLFINIDNEYFRVLSYFPNSKANPFKSLKLSRQNPIVRYLKQTKKTVTGETIATLTEPEYSRSRATAVDGVKILLPMISRTRLIGILIIGEKTSGEYSLQDYKFLENIIEAAATSMEKEFLREESGRQKKELSVINRSSAIMASSLDIQLVFDSFIKELKKIAKIDWAAINVVGDGYLYFLALFSEINSPWKLRERIPSTGTATEWVSKHKRAIVEPDLVKEHRFSSGPAHLEQGIRSTAYLPLTSHGITFGSLTLASRQPNAYSQRLVVILKELTSQIIMPIEHSQLYAEVEEEARIDKLTGLFNRRSFDETMMNEISRYSRYGGVFSLIISDIDHLAAINDNFGHLAGDEALRQIGTVIRKAVRVSDRAFRYGGDEFAIFLPNTFVDAATMVADRIRKQIALLTVAPQTRVTVSLGLATWPADGTDAYTIISAADTALYEAKRSGGDQIRSTQPTKA